MMIPDHRRAARRECLILLAPHRPLEPIGGAGRPLPGAE